MKKIQIFQRIDRWFISEMHHWAIPTLRVALGIVFFWFGALKLAGFTPVTQLVAETYHFFPTDSFLFILGVWEVCIGLGLLTKVWLRVTLFFLWLQMVGTIGALVLNPGMFFLYNNPLLLTVEGEFVVKNFVLIAGSLVVAGYETHQA